LTWQDVVYQSQSDKLELGWSSSDVSGVNRTLLVVDMWGQAGGSAVTVAAASNTPQTLTAQISTSDTLSPVLWVMDKAGNEVGWNNSVLYGP
jgi:hypothetical protein